MNLKTLAQQHKHHIILGLIVGFVFVVGMVTPQVSHAAFGISLSGIITGIFKAIAYIFSYIAGIFLAIAAGLTSYALELNYDVANPAVNTIADVGWRISRDIANFGFVMLTVVMGFMTIIRVQSFGSKKLLVSIITTAVLVNFSFAIVGAIVDFSNVLTHFFIGRIDTGGGNGLSQALANAFGPQRFFLEESDDPIPPDPSQEEDGLLSFGVAVLSSIAGLLFIVFFSFLAVIVLLMLAAMFIVRYVTLTFLLVLAPMAWLSGIFPGLGKAKGMWWSKFWTYTFFAPASSFFVYLSLLAAQELTERKAALASVGADLPGALATIVQNGTQLIVVAGLMTGAIMVAKQMGIEGAGMAEKAKDGLIKGAKTWGKNKASNLGTRLSKTKTGGELARTFGFAGKTFKGTADKWEKESKEAKEKHAQYTAKRDEIKLAEKTKAWSPEKIEEEKRKLKESGGKLGLGKKIGLWSREKTLGAGAKAIGGAWEKTGQTIDKQALKKIEGGGYVSSMAKSAVNETGLFKKAEKKDEQKTAAELEKDHQKLIDEKKKFVEGGRFKADDAALKELNKKIELSEGKLISAKNNKYRGMTTEELQKEYSSILDKQKKGGSKDEQNINRRTKESLEKLLSGKMSGKMTTSGQIDDAIKEARNAADKAAIDGQDATFYQDMVSSLERQKSTIESKLKATGKAFNVIEQKINDLTKTRGSDLKIARDANKDMSDDDIKNLPHIQDAQTQINTEHAELSELKRVLSGGKKGGGSGTKTEKIAAYNKLIGKLDPTKPEHQALISELENMRNSL